MRGVIKKGQQLLKVARSNRIPIIQVADCFAEGHSNLKANSPLISMVKNTNALVKGTCGADFIEEVKPLNGEHIVESQRVGPYEGTNLSDLIKKTGAETVLLYGVATNIVVETTSRTASDQGYNVIVVEDCCSAGSPEAYQTTIETLALLTTISTLNELKEKLSFNSTDPTSSTD